MMKRLAVLMVLMLLTIPGLSGRAQSPTDTPTPTPTLSNEQRMSLSTIVPPPQCGTVFTPCGLMPWPYIQFPTLALPSPTLIAPQQVYGNNTITPTPTATNTPNVTPTPSYTPESPLDLGPVNTLVDSFNGVSSTMMAQSTVSIEISGTPQTVSGLSDQLSTGVPSVFSFIKGVAGATHSTTFSLIGFALVVLLFVLLVYLITLFMPIILMVVRLVLHVIQTFKPF